MTTRLHVYVSGRVQGVFYRASTQQEAQARGLNGWVRNMPDGRVEAVFEGPRDQLEAVLHWCHQGPKWASVDTVEAHWEEGEAQYEAFRCRY